MCSGIQLNIRQNPVKLKEKSFNIAIIVVCAPTAKSTEAEIDNICNSLEMARPYVSHKKSQSSWETGMPRSKKNTKVK